MSQFGATILSKRALALLALFGYLIYPVAAFAGFTPGQVTDPNCLPSDSWCNVDVFSIPASGAVINSTTSTPSSVTNRLYNLSGVLFWAGSSLGMSTGTISSINGLTGALQYFSTGNSGSDFNVVSTGTTHTLNIPDAGASARGVVSTSSQSFSGAKNFLGVLTVSSSAIFNSTLRLASLGGGLLATDANGNVSTTSIGLQISNSLTSAQNILTSIVSGQTSTTSLINSLGASSSANTLSLTVNGTTSPGVNIVNSNSITVSGGVITTAVNGIAATSGLTTSAISEGSNLYFTSARGNSNFASNLAATTSDAVAEGGVNKYYTDARARASLSSAVVGLSYATSTGVLSLSSGYAIPLSASTTDWQSFFASPSSRIAVGAGLTWMGSTLVNSATTSYASATTDGLVSTTSQVFSGAKTFNGAISLGGALSVTGSSTFATASVAQLTASGPSLLSAAVTLSALSGGLLRTDSSGVVSTTSLSSLSTNSLSSASNILTSIVNGVTSTTTSVNSVTPSSSGNVLTVNVNGVTGTTTTVNSVSNTSSANTLSTTVNGVTGSTVNLINSNTLTSSANTLQGVINGVGTTTANIINSNALSWLGQTLTSTINGVATTTVISYANTTTDGLVSSSTQTFGGNKTFNGTVSLGSTLGVTGVSTLATTSATQFTASGASTLSAALTLSALTGGLLQANSSGSVSTTSLASLVSNSFTSSVNVLTSNINGVLSTTSAVNSVAPSLLGNVLTVNVNGVSGTSSLINSNALTSSVNTLQSVINGVGTTTANIINTSALSWLGQTLTSTINGVTATTTISLANVTTDGLMSSTTQSFGGNKTFNGYVGVSSTPSYALDVRSTGNSGVAGFFQANNSTINGIVTIQDATDASPGTSKLFVAFQASGGGTVGSISGGALGGTSFNTISDRRIKENIATTTRGLDALLRIPVRDYSMKADSEHRMTQGFIAQELVEVYPDAVSISDDGSSTLSTTSIPWSVDYGRMTPLIVRSVQDVESQIAGLYGTRIVATSTYMSPSDLVGATFASMASDTTAYISERIIDGARIAREIVVGRIVAIEGWFDRVVSKAYCSSDSTGAIVCMNGDDMKILLEIAGRVSGSPQVLVSPGNSVTTSQSSSSSIPSEGGLPMSESVDSSTSTSSAQSIDFSTTTATSS